MKSPVRVFLPCDVFTVRVRFGSGAELTELEHLLLRAVRAREHSIPALKDLFGLTERMLHDILFDLWKIGYLAISFDRGEVFLAGEAALWAEGKGDLSRLASLEAEDTRQVMIDRFVGHVYPLAGESSPPNPHFVAPDNLGPLPLAEATTEKLVSALSRVAAGEAKFGPIKQVLSAYVPFNRVEGVFGRRWFGIDVVPSTVRETQRIVAQVITTRGLPPGVRHSIERELGRLLDDRPDHPLSKALLSRARNNRWRPRYPEDALENLERRLNGITEIEPAACAELHDGLLDLAGDLAAEVEERQLAEARIHVVAGSVEHDRATRELIRGAEHQIILSSPYLSERGLGPLRDELSTKMGIGVRVFIMWGLANVDAGDAHLALSDATRDIINGLEAKFPEQFFCSYIPSRIHAKVLVQDDRRALVTSLNILDPSNRSVVEVGVLIDGHDDRRRPALVQELLSWARRTYPVYGDSRAILRSVPGFISEGGDAAESHPQPKIEFPPDPPEVEQSAAAGIARAAANLWLEQWRSFAARMRDEISRGRTATRIVLNEEHTRLLGQALEAARSRILIVSDMISPEVVDGEFLRRLVLRAANGVAVRLVFRRFKGGDELGAPLKQALEAAVASTEGKFTWVQANTHGKILVADDSVVVTSFNFLSFAGAYPEQRAARARRQSSELGVLCTGLGVANSIITALEKVCPTAVAEFIPSRVAEAAVVGREPDAERSAKPPMQMVLAALASGGTEVSLEDVFGMAEQPWELLEHVVESGLESDTMRRTVAACVAVAGASAAAPDLERWVRRLAASAWERADPFESALLAAYVGGTAGDGLPAMCALVVDIALSDVDSVDTALTMLLRMDNLTECDSAVVALLALVCLLGMGRADAADLLVQGAVLSDPWPEVLGEVEAYWKDTFEPFPTEYFRVLAEQAETERHLDAAWLRLTGSIEEASREHFKFPEGTKIWAYLFHPEGRFGKLRRHAASRDARAVRSWLRTEPVTDHDQLLLNTAVEVHGSARYAIAGNKREACVEALEDVVNAARAVVTLNHAGSEEGPNWVVERAAALRNSMASAWPELADAARSAVSSETLPVMSRALGRLRDILSLE